MDTDWGMKWSKNGFNILTCDIKDQIFNSGKNSFKVIAQGQTTISVLSSDINTKYVSINHGLSYAPGFKAYCQLNNANYSYPVEGLDLFSGNGEEFYADSDTTRVRFGVYPGGVTFTAVIYYYILADPAA